MAWERRNRGGLYYTRSRKIQGRVVREYIGGGLVGQIAAAQDARRRTERKAQSEAWKEAQRRLDAADTPLEAFSEACDFLTQMLLVPEGYHRDKNLTWRKKRCLRKRIS